MIQKLVTTLSGRSGADYAARMTPRLLAALTLTLAVLPAHAEVFKWIDAKGQVNYSNKPPADAAKLAQPVEERLSVVGGDGASRDSAARLEARLAQRAKYEELDWQQRQRAMVVHRGTPTVACGYGGYCGDNYSSSSYDGTYGQYYPAYYTPYSYGGRVFNAGVPRPVRPPHVSHHGGNSVRR